MFKISDLLDLVDLYKAAAGIEADGTVSYRVFSDSKKLKSLRGGREITTGRFNEAVIWFDENWPEGCQKPEIMHRLMGRSERAEMPEDDAA